MNFRDLAEGFGIRGRLAQLVNKTFGGRRNLFKALGYQEVLLPENYRARFNRNAVANRIVKALPQATWRGGAELVEDEDPTKETAFEAAFADLNKRLKIWSVLQQADVLGGIGRYSVILIGAPGDLDTPLQQASPEEIVYLNAFAEEDAKIERFIIDIKDARFGLPEFYTISRTTMTSPTSVNSDAQARRVHWTRVIHLADGALDDKIYGEPRLRCIWNLIDDLEKVTGGGAEAFWRRADQGVQFDLDPTLDVKEPQKDALKKQIHEYEHDLRRYLLTRGVTVNSIGSDVADFSRPVESIISQISAGTGIPQRILMGSERGQLASTQDRSNWDDRVADRRKDYAGPCVVRPLVDRLIALGALPAPQVGDYDVQWPELKVLDDSQRAQVAKDWAALNRDMAETVVTPNDIRERVLNLPPLGEVLSEEPGGGIAAPDAQVPVVAAAKGGASWKSIHRAADRFRTARPTYRQRLLLRRAARDQSHEAGAGASDQG